MHFLSFEDLILRSHKSSLAHPPAFWRILVGNGKSGRCLDGTLKVSTGRRANTAQISTDQRRSKCLPFYPIHAIPTCTSSLLWRLRLSLSWPSLSFQPSRLPNLPSFQRPAVRTHMLNSCAVKR